MAITPDKDPMNIVASTIVKDVTEKVGNSIKKKIVESTVLVVPVLVQEQKSLKFTIR